MNEIERMLNQENAEKKRIARGDRNKVRGGGKTVKMPSDYLTKKEREKLNGEVIHFDPRKFYSWEEFKALPDEFQLKWVNSIINRYDVGVTNISTICFGLSKVSLYKYLKTKGLIEYVNVHEGHSSAAGKEKLAADMAQEQPEEETPEPEAPEPVTTDISNLALLLQSLVGTGAKLTIEVTL